MPRASRRPEGGIEGLESGDTSRDDEEDPVRDVGDRLVELTEPVGEAETGVGRRVDREPDLFGDDDRGIGAPAERVEERGGVDGEAVRPGDPAPEGVDEDGAGGGADRVGERGSALDGRPRVGSARLVRVDPLREDLSATTVGTTTVTGSPRAAATRAATSDFPERVPPMTSVITRGRRRPRRGRLGRGVIRVGSEDRRTARRARRWG